jgi:hypothetical protein
MISPGPPVKDAQGEWQIADVKYRNPGETVWGGCSYGEGCAPIYNIKGTWIEVTLFGQKATHRLIADPKAFPVGGPTGVRYIDYSGLEHTGSYTLKDGQLVLTLIANAPIKDRENVSGTKYLTITLEPYQPLPVVAGFHLGP